MKVNKKNLLNLKNDLKYIYLYVDKSKLFFNELEVLLNDNCSLEEIRNLLKNFKSELNVK